jgi:glycosyltransferase involved in cell wall biosynthesis
MIVFSVVICTYNRSSLLKQTLVTVLKQSLDISLYEVIVVDNNSKDNTQQVVDQLNIEGCSVRYVLEKKVGLSHARNRGLHEAKGKYVVYTDDDCQLPTEWLSVANEICRSTSPGMLGGPVHPFYLGNKPPWCKDEYNLIEYGNVSRVLGQNEFLIGCNFFIRKDLFQILGEFDTRYGMTGKKVGYSEETELQERMRTLVPKESIYYDPRLYVKHLVRKDQLEWRWLVRSFYSKGKANFLLRTKSESERMPKYILFYRIGVQYLKTLLHAVHGLLFRSRSKFPYFKNYLVERISGHIKKLGYYSQQW